MKIKKIGSIVLTIVLVLTLFTSAFSTLSVFADDTENKQMLHLTPTTTNSKFGIYVPVASVTAGEYVVQFKYKFTNGQLHDNFSGAESNPGAVFAVYNRLGANDGTHNGLDWTPICCPGWGGTYTKTDLNANTVQYTFNITQSHIDANKGNTLASSPRGFFIGFYTPKAADFYIADIVMYKSENTDKTNILPEYFKSGEGGNWRCGINQSKEYEGTCMSYDADLIGDNQMLHLNPSDTDANKIGMKVHKDSLTTGSYTVQFKYKFAKGALCYGITGATDPNYSAATDAAVFSIYSNQYDAETPQKAMQYVKCPGSGLGDYTYSNLNSNTVEYNFNITTTNINECQDYFYLGFSVKGTPEFYITDMVMYQSDDADKTNILPEYPTISDWKYGTYITFRDGILPSGSSYMYYDSSLFDVEQMLHLKTSENSRTGVKVHKDELKVNTNYTVRFDYKFNEGYLVFGSSSLTNAVQFAVFSNQYNDTDLQTKMQYVSALNDGVDGNDYTFKNIDGNTVEFTFNTSYYQGLTTDYYYIGFVGFKGTCDFYISDMVMYETADPEEKNLLPEDEISTNWCNMVYNPWTYNANKLPNGSAYMVYDETYFAESEVTLGDGNGVEGIDIRDLVELHKVVSYKIYNINYDINKDGNVTVADLPLLRNHLLGIELIA